MNKQAECFNSSKQYYVFHNNSQVEAVFSIKAIINLWCEG